MGFSILYDNSYVQMIFSLNSIRNSSSNENTIKNLGYEQNSLLFIPKGERNSSVLKLSKRHELFGINIDLD